MSNALHICCAAKGISLKKISEITGYSYGHILNISCGSQQSTTARRKIEESLGMPPGSIWREMEEFNPNQETTGDV
ncbi:MAG: hypothetical protein K9M45_12835 [Kiritimatiellales bacterium]|nr:hypothetical protein [Kiritimatiellales bacterium]